MTRLIFISLFITCCMNVVAQPTQKTIEDEKARSLITKVRARLSVNELTSYNFTQTNRYFGHLFEPWQTNEYQVKGSYTLASNTETLYIQDNRTFRGKSYQSTKVFTPGYLMWLDYGQNEPNKVSAEDADNYLGQSALYSPVFYLDDFLSINIDKQAVSYSVGTLYTIAYKTKNGNLVSIRIDNKKMLLSSIQILYPHELYGDVLKTLTYEYLQNPKTKTYYPNHTKAEELGIVASEVSIAIAESDLDIDSIKQLIPNEYRLSAPSDSEVDISYTQYNNHIHLLDFKHTDDKVMIVEFDDFLLVAEAPINSSNGELIIEKAKEIAPNKPIRYFVFGHHHPHYIGGIRAFVANKSTVLCYKENETYVKQITQFKHTFKPDQLEKAPQDLALELIDGKKIISDGDFEMHIIHIGAMSSHTKDYLIYYFP